MTNTALSQRIVVGIDGSGPSRTALAWACLEAQRTQQPLHLVHSYALLHTYAGAGAYVAFSPSDNARLEADARAVLVDAVTDATAQADVKITSELLSGSASQALVEASRGARSVVVGARGHGPLTSLLVGSVSTQVALHAHVPVIVVKGRDEPDQDRHGVTVGVDGYADSQACLAFAFEQASSRGTHLDVVHAWSLERSQGRGVMSEAMAAEYEVEPRHELLLAESLAGWAERYPDVELRGHVVHQHAADALLERSQTAELLVVGSRGRGGFAGLLLGSVSHAVLQRASGTVAVVRDVDGE